MDTVILVFYVLKERCERASLGKQLVHKGILKEPRKTWANITVAMDHVRACFKLSCKLMQNCFRLLH
jgi:hypothetical protein